MKKTGIITIIAIVALLAVVVATLVSGTYARYATTQEATATLATAAWSFSAGFGTEKTTTLNLYDTITKTDYPNLAANHIAPGTSGSFEIVIDTTGCEVGVDYTVKFEMATGDVIPTGLIFTIDGEEMTGDDGAVTKTGTIALANVGTVTKKTVTWNWTYGDNQDDDNYDTNEITGANNDEANQDYTMNVTIKGEQHIGAIS